MSLLFEPGHFFLLGDVAAEHLLTGGHDWPLVILSVMIAAGASYLALTLAALARRIHSPSTRRLHLATGALALGGGVWSMHFIGMLAFELCTPVDYDVPITLASGLPAVLAAGITLSLLSRPAVSGARIAVAGLAVGSGIGAMHYIGMAAMTMGPLLRYDPALFAASLVVAVGLASLALWISFGLRNLGVVRKSARSLLSLLNDILDTAKLESGATELENRNFSLRDVCEQIVATLSLAAAQKSLQLELEYDPAAGEFFTGDPLRIHQVLLNLASNAVKFTERGRVCLRVSAGEEPGRVLLQVADTGMGMSEDVLEHLFDPFVQADSSMTRRYGGTGLGTTIARQLVELMGGTITVNSTPDVGTEFRVAIPLPPGERPEDEAAPLEEVCLPPLDVLVVDDVEQNVELLATVLGKRGHRVRTASNGEEAVSCWRTSPCDLVLMDVQMPVLNGHDACRQIRELERRRGAPRTPIIALTASVLLEDRRRARAAGMDGFVTKPLDVQGLLNEMARVIEGGAPEAVASHTLPAQEQQPLVDDARIIELWGSRVAHERAARRYLQTLPAELAALEAGMSAEAAAASLHRLRGAAGNLLLVRLASALAALEARIGEPGRSDEALESAYAACAATRARFPVGARDADPARGANIPLDLELLERVVQRLQHGEIPAAELQDLAVMLPAGEAAALDEAVENFDTEAAGQVLTRFRDSRAVEIS